MFLHHKRLQYTVRVAEPKLTVLSQVAQRSGESGLASERIANDLPLLFD